MSDLVRIVDFLVDTADPEWVDDLLRQHSPNACVQGRGMPGGIVYREGYPVVRVFGDLSRFQFVIALYGIAVVKEIPLDHRGQPTSLVGPLQRGEPGGEERMNPRISWEKWEEQLAELRRLREQRRNEEVKAEHMQQHARDIQRVRARMVEAHFEPTLADFGAWIRTSFTFHKDRQTWWLEQEQGRTLNALLELLSEEEVWDWHMFIDDFLKAQNKEA